MWNRRSFAAICVLCAGRLHKICRKAENLSVLVGPTHPVLWDRDAKRTNDWQNDLFAVGMEIAWISPIHHPRRLSMRKVVSAAVFTGLMGLACMASASEIGEIREDMSSNMSRLADDMDAQRQQAQHEFGGAKERMKSEGKAAKQQAKAKRKQMKADAKAKTKAKKEAVRAKSKALKHAGEGMAHEAD